MAKKHGYWNKSGDFVETASKEEATYAWRKERGYKAEGVFATDDGGVIDTRGQGKGGGGGGKDAAPTNLLGDEGKPEMPARGKPEVPGMAMSEAAKLATSGYDPTPVSVWDAAKAAGLPDYAVPGWSPPDPRDDFRRGRGAGDLLAGPRSTQPSAAVSMADVYSTDAQDAMRQRTLNENVRTGQAVADLIPSGAEGPAALFSIIDAAAELGISEHQAQMAYASYNASQVASGAEGRNGFSPSIVNESGAGATRPIDIDEDTGMPVDALLAWGGRYTKAAIYGGVDQTGTWFEGAIDSQTGEMNPDKMPILLSPDMARVVLGEKGEEIRQAWGYNPEYPYELMEKPSGGVGGGYAGYGGYGGGYGRGYSPGSYGSGGGYVSTPLVMWRIGT